MQEYYSPTIYVSHATATLYLPNHHSSLKWKSPLSAKTWTYLPTAYSTLTFGLHRLSHLRWQDTLTARRRCLFQSPFDKLKHGERIYPHHLCRWVPSRIVSGAYFHRWRMSISFHSLTRGYRRYPLKFSASINILYQKFSPKSKFKFVDLLKP